MPSPPLAGDLTFLGLQGMIDPPRPEAIAAVRSCRSAGIRVKMITGDHLATARAIASQIGLDDSPEPHAVSGQELERLSGDALADAAERTAVFARVVPEQKLLLVQALQSHGLISSAFDFLTFVVLLQLNATMEQFRTGWFIESIVSAALIVLVVRSRRYIYRSRPSRLLTCATFAIVGIALLVPHLPFFAVLGFQSMPPHFYPIIGLIVGFYVAAAEVAKHLFYGHARNS